jgi:hypothetical protein
MNPKLLPVYLLFVCQLELFAEPTETRILWSTVSPTGTYAVGQSEPVDKTAAPGDPGSELAIVNIQTKQQVLVFSGFNATDFAPLGLIDGSPIHSFCVWAPQEDHLLIVNGPDPLTCLQVDLPDGRVAKVGPTVAAAATRIANKRTAGKTSNSDVPFSIIDAHFISSHACYLTVNYDSGSGPQRRVDLYFQVNSGANSLVFDRSEPYPDSNQPIGASILAGRLVEHLYQTLRGLLNEPDRQLLTMQQQSWLGGREFLANYEDRVAFSQIRIAELRKKLKEELQKK